MRRGGSPAVRGAGRHDEFFIPARGFRNPDELVFTAALNGVGAMAVTDINSVAGVVRAYEAAKKVAGFKLIVGTCLTFVDRLARRAGLAERQSGLHAALPAADAGAAAGSQRGMRTAAGRLSRPRRRTAPPPFVCRRA